MRLRLPCKGLPGRLAPLLLIFVLQLMSLCVSAQETKIIRGRVTTSDGAPVSNATVTVKGTSRATSTAADGSFSIEASDNATLVISSIGYNTSEIAARGAQLSGIRLQQSASRLDEVVVVGYGTQRRKDLTGSVSVVDVEDARKTVTHDVARMLQGQVPGVTVHGSGEPGGFVQMKIRGISTFGNNNPLFIVDGVQMANPFDISPNDIESVQVLKDASAGAIYGVRAYAGVVIITTKKARSGELKVDYNGYAGVQNLAKRLSVTDAAGYRKITNAAEVNAGLAIAPGNDPTSPRFISNVNTDWQKEGFKTGVIQDHNLRLSGGTEAAAYNLSLGYFDQSSTYKGPQNYTRYTVNAGLTGKKGIVSYGTKVLYTKSERINPFNGMQFHAVFGGAVTSLVTAIPTMPVYDPARLRGYGGSDNATQRAITLNVIGMNALLKNTSDRNRALGNFWGEIEPVKNLKYRINLSYDRTDFRNFAFEPTYDLGWYYLNTQSYMFEGKGADLTSIIENTLNYSLKKGAHTVDLLAGQAFQKFNNNWTNGSGVGLPEPYFYNFSSIADPASKSLASGGGTATLLSFFGRVNYNFESRYLITGNFRRDGTSRFRPDLRWGNFASVAAAWNIHNEKFINLPSAISSLKLRGGIGELGNQDIEFYEYQSYINTNASYVFGNSLAPGATVVTLVDPGIQWERKMTSNVAMDLGLMGDKLVFTAEYYSNKTKDLLARVPISLSVGSFPWDVRANVASTQNTGYEFSLQYHGRKSRLTYDINANMHTLKNKVLKLGGKNEPVYGAASKTEVGRSVGELFGHKMVGIFQSAQDIAQSATQINSAPGDVKFQDTNKDGRITDDDRIYLGRSIPNLYYGLNFGLGYQQLDFSMFWQGSAGNKVYNGIYHDLMLGQYSNHHTDMLNFWTPTNTNTNIPRPVIGDPNANARASDRFIQDGSYVRLQNFQLGYRFNLKSASVLKVVKNARVYVSGQNVITVSKYKGYDPDFMSDGLFSRGFDIGSFPNPRTFTFGAQLSF
jgi:TonB-linked SusC/RagA family outer membrane protein